jgi:1-aminocyclopropane-1-carboxylate deaminase
MDIIDERNVRIDSLHKDWYNDKVACVDMLRLDLLHEVVSGNKWYKLRLNLQQALEGNYKTILTFGGGYSNHLVATAYAAKMAGLGAVGIVRGKYETLTPSLQFCKDQGMELVFVAQDDYKNKHRPHWLRELVAHFDELFIIPEGGDNELGRKGAGLITRFIDKQYTHVVLSVGSGTTLAGVRNELDAHQYVVGMVPMKQGKYLHEHIANHLLPEGNRNWQLYDQWHFGGFGKWNDELLGYMNAFYEMNKIPLDIVYTGKMMYGLQQLINDGAFAADSRILCIHTGGLQGNASVKGLLVY